MAGPTVSSDDGQPGGAGGPLLALGLVAAIGIRGAIPVSGVFGLLAAGPIVYAVRHIERPAPVSALMSVVLQLIFPWPTRRLTPWTR
ncbi:MAG: hypothetical protein WBZ40_02220 [Acidimicrobiia bacterium]